MIEVETDDAPGAKSIRMALQPAKVLAGRVIYADTGKPVPARPYRDPRQRDGSARAPADRLPDR